MLSGKKIVLGVSASIAAYKSAFLVRLLVKEGAEVKVVLTPAATSFVTPLTLSTLSNNPVNSAFTQSEDENAMWTNHVELGLWADLMIIAPATSNTLAKMVSGTCDNLLLATYMSAKCPVYVAPAMDLDMYKNPATQQNLDALKRINCHLIDAQHGELASGLVGQGRMAEPEEIVAFITNKLKEGLPLAHKNVLINAGPTYERIDAVRFIGNFSTGKMGVALAQQALKMGANVTLVLGPTQVNHNLRNMEVVRVESAAEMNDACQTHFAAAEIAILTAAVSDYKPINQAKNKLKKGDAELVVKLEPTIDILSGLGKKKSSAQTLVGFALETDNELEYAKDKLARKNLDMVVLNSLRDKGAGFGHDTNKITVIAKGQSPEESELLPKDEIAQLIWHKILELKK